MSKTYTLFCIKLNRINRYDIFRIVTSLLRAQNQEIRTESAEQSVGWRGEFRASPSHRYNLRTHTHTLLNAGSAVGISVGKRGHFQNLKNL